MTNLGNSTFDDGFPKKPIDAIEFSYFLSESEKQEWREWILTATSDQQDELVNILHSMWQDNQKNAVPESFANNVSAPLPVAPAENRAPGNFTNSFAANTTKPVAQPQENNIPATGTLEPVTPNNQFQQQPQLTPAPSFVQQAKSNPFKSDQPPAPQSPDFFQNQAQPNKPPQPEEYSFDPAFNQNLPQPQQETKNNPFFSSPNSDFQPNFQNPPSQGSITPIPKPQKEEPKPEPFHTKPASNLPAKKPEKENYNPPKKPENREKVDMDSLVNGKQGYAPNPLLNSSFNDDTNQDPRPFEYDKKAQTKPGNPIPKKTFNPNQKEQNKKREEDYYDYSKVRQSTAKNELEHIYAELNQTMESQRKYTDMVRKIAVIIESYDQVTGYFEQIMAKVLNLNDVVRKLTTEQSKISKQVSDNSLQDEVDSLRRDLDKLTRDFKDENRENRAKFNDLNSELSGIGVDVFGPSGGAKEKLQILQKEVAEIKKIISSKKPNESQQAQNQIGTRNSQDPKEQNIKKPERSFFNRE
jgi:hypothetical protein